VSFDPEVVTYKLQKYTKTNQGTTVDLNLLFLKEKGLSKDKFLPKVMQQKRANLPLGRNLMVAFMPWQGYNYEDAIVISENCSRRCIHFSSLMNTVLKFAIQNVVLKNLLPIFRMLAKKPPKNLDENGLIRIGADVKPGDILIGKITPKGESDPSP
jgi:DNA-directed RNA polymerase subunit beta